MPMLSTSMASAGVFGLAVGCLGTRCTGVADLLAPKPAALEFSAAAAVPTVCLTVDIVVRQAARAHAPGDYVLVHAAAGGVGMTAVGVVLSALQMQCVSTAGSPHKRHLVRTQLHTQCAGSSRSTHFAELAAQVAQSGAGVGAVLSSLTSAGMVAGTLSVLGCAAHYTEIGKREVWSSSRMAMERADVHYSLVALDFAPLHITANLLSAIACSAASGELIDVLPQSVHQLRAVSAAMRCLMQAKHSGKVVVRTCVASAAGTSSAHGSAAVTGGLGSLGALVGLWLGQCTISTVRLLGRTGHVAQHSSPAVLAQAALDTSATCVYVQGVDVGSACGAAQAAALEPSSMMGAAAPMPMLRTLMHAGGVLRDATLLNQTHASMMEVCAPKVSGAWGLMQAGLHSMPMHMTVLFSSIAALMGSPGQANYSAANSALDALAHHLQRSGQAQVSVQWGPWSGGGMAVQSHSTASRASRMGMSMLTADQGLGVLGALLHGMPAPARMVSDGGLRQLPQVTVSPIEWPKLTQQLGNAVPDLLLEFAPYSLLSADQHSTESSITRSRVAATAHAAAKTTKHDVQAQVMAAVRNVLGADIAPDEPLMDAGLDSLGAVEFQNVIQQSFGIELPVTSVFDYPSVSALSMYIQSEVSATDCTSSPISASDDKEALVGSTTAMAAGSPRDAPHGLLAVMSMAACTSGGSALPDTLQPAGCHRNDGVRAVPPARWDVQAQHRAAPDSPLPAAFGGFVQDVELFDEACFGVSHMEAGAMDPQQRLLLRQATVGLCMVGAAPWGSSTHTPSTGVGVFVGISTTDYARILQRSVSAAPNAYAAPGGALSVAAGRLSYTYGAQGPAVSVDTACSSSLVSTHLACQSWTLAQCQTALVGGVNLTLDPLTTASFIWSGMLAADGRCKTLDAAADGYVRGEACTVVVLSGGDHSTLIAGDARTSSLGVRLAGSAVNQDGRSSSLTAPNGPAQQTAMRSALHDARLAVRAVALLEVHGTGTALGDPIEMGAACAVLSSSSGGNREHQYEHKVGISAAKSWVGHTEAGAGTVGLWSAHTCITQSAMAPLAHLRQLSPHVISSASAGGAAPWMMLSRVCMPGACADQDQLQQESSQPVIAGVSAFAFQGTNAHVLLALSDHDCGQTCVTTEQCSRPPFHSRRHWSHASSHPLQHHAALSVTQSPSSPPSASAAVRMEVHVDMQHAGVYMHDHRVADQKLFAGAGYLEVAYAAAHTIMPLDGLAKGADCILALSHLSLPQPLILPSSHHKAGGVRTLVCAVTPAEGRFEVLSAASAHERSASRPKAAVHMRGSVAQVHLVNTLVSKIACKSYPDGWLPPSAATLISSPAHSSSTQLSMQRSMHGWMSAGSQAACMPDSEYWAHPACLDNTMQLGAAGAMGRTSSTSSSKTLVPAAMIAYSVCHSPSLMVAACTPAHQVWLSPVQLRVLPPLLPPSHHHLTLTA